MLLRLLPVPFLVVSLAAGCPGAEPLDDDDDDDTGEGEGEGEEECGNGIIEPDNGEFCDGPPIFDCGDLGLGFGEIECTPQCNFDVSGCDFDLCGNGEIDADQFEECDGANLNGFTCASFGFAQGTLACDPFFCFFDTFNCTDVCGDGQLGPTEQCDGAGGFLPTCEDFELAGGNAVVCSGTCELDISACTPPVCGNGVAEGNFAEQCDDDDLRGQTCETLGFLGGDLECDFFTCTLDTSGCTDVCGDNDVTGLEQCDGTDLAFLSCEAFGFGGGTLGCSDQCTFDFTACTDVCGDFTVGPTEGCDDGDGDPTDGCDNCSLTVCDAPPPIDETGVSDDTTGGDTLILSNCSFDFAQPSDVYVFSAPGPGLLTVNADSQSFQVVGIRTDCELRFTEQTCTFIDPSLGATLTVTVPDAQDVFITVHAGFFGESGPYQLDVVFEPAVCGDNVLTPPEACDTDDLAGQTCESLEFASGSLSCVSDCSAFDTSNCVPSLCGNNVREGGEVCDNSDAGDLDCDNFGLANGTLLCDDDCEGVDLSQCETPVCGDGAIEGFENCEGTDLGGADCASIGFETGELSCNAPTCRFDTSLCEGGICAPCVIGEHHGQCGDACSITVCEVDPFCCENSWDSACVSEAESFCGANCP